MDQNITPNGPATTVSTISRSKDASTSFLPYSIAALVVAVIGTVVILIQLTSVNAKEQQMSQALDEQKTVYNSLSDVADQVNQIDVLVKGLSQAYQAQVPFDKVLDLVEKTSYQPAVYDAVGIDQKGKVSLVGTVDRYNNFAQLVKAIKGQNDNDGITDEVNIDSASQGVSNVSTDGGTNEQVQTKFSINFQIKPDLFKDPTIFAGYET